MHRTLLPSVFFAFSLAAPLTSTNTTDSWRPAEGSITTCNTESAKIIDFLVGPQLDTVLNDACAEMMPPCAYQELLPESTACTKSIEWPLESSKKSTQSANVESAEGNKMSGWNVQCKFVSTNLVMNALLTLDDSCRYARAAVKSHPWRLLDEARMLRVLCTFVAKVEARRLLY
jgi:hypothetical protein